MDQRGSDFPFRRSTVAGPSTATTSNNSNGGRGGGFDPELDSFEAMRQRMDRDRDVFFDQPGRARSPWNVRPDDGFFGNHGFDSALPGSRFDRMGGFPEPPSMHRGFTQQQQQQQPHFQQQQQHQGTPPKHHSVHNTPYSIPIRVVHESSPAGSPNTRAAPKQFTGGRNTTELPARGSPQNSPRLERAHSEPPKVFNQRLFGAGRPNYSTIPESGSGDLSGGPPRGGVGGGGLHVPEGSPNNLSTSASAPSVPHSQNNGGAPVPPPRRGSPSKKEQQQYYEPQQQQQHYQHQDPRKDSSGNIRHIPIFVEGRSDPVVSRGTDAPGTRTRPSEFYPAGTKRTPQQHPAQEPTTPQGPPPGPIPMGCSPQHMQQGQQKPNPQEPTSPLPAPDGPIPLPCSPNLYNAAEQVDSAEPKKEPSPPKQEQKPAQPEKVFSVPISVPKEPSPPKKAPSAEPQQQPPAPPPPPPPQQQRKVSTKEDIALEKIQKVKADIAEVKARIEAFQGDKKDKEYLFLEERLMRNLLLLDSVETHGQEDLRGLRKESIKSVNRCLSLLDSRTRVGQEGTISEDAEENNAVLAELAEKSK